MLFRCFLLLRIVQSGVIHCVVNTFLVPITFHLCIFIFFIINNSIKNVPTFFKL